MHNENIESYHVILLCKLYTLYKNCEIGDQVRHFKRSNKNKKKLVMDNKAKSMI